MDSRFHDIAEQLLLIERELRALGWWETTPPSEEALSSQEPFCVDTLEFAQWLQWIFLPRMKIILERDLPLPNASGILEMAEMAYAGKLNETRLLQQSLARFDQLITQAG
ncbi:pseudouridine synthase [Pseudomonas floridensis]|uniref:Pseudouridine synthase n=1 Tax=Pseudomonas floridensis TaxID=1958950 RepID=A0A1X0N7P5_9PSED|nr:YqcC family protein [Pseudomonas floridensis]ORC59809.1 pseudouridine synthase [Pseudomonas floridensis]